MPETAKTFLATGPAARAGPSRTVLPRRRRCPLRLGRAEGQVVTVQLRDGQLRGKQAGRSDAENEGHR